MALIEFKNLPDTSTPLTAENLNNNFSELNNKIPTATTNLTDVESGEFVPTVYGSTTAGTATYTTQIGEYVKVGKLVHIEIRLACTLTGSSGLLLVSIPNFGATRGEAIANVVTTLTANNVPWCTRKYGNAFLLGTYELGNITNKNWDTTNYIYISGTIMLA